MQTFEWRPFNRIDFQQLRTDRIQFHRAVQNVAAVARKFLHPTANDGNAVLTWIPGLSRLAGKWVKGNLTFRSSLGFEEFTIFLVDEKVNTLASFELEGRTHRELMIWLEEQIGKFGLDATNLTMNLPYELPFLSQNSDPFHLLSPDSAEELAKYYHNTFVVLRSLKAELVQETSIYIWPHHFDEALSLVLKDTGDPATDTRISLGMSPGDNQFENPYFYVSSWPYTDISQCTKLENNAKWISGDWTGAVLLSKNLFEGEPQKILTDFYHQASEQLIELLTK